MSRIEISKRALSEIYRAFRLMQDRTEAHALASSKKEHNPEVASFWEGYLSGVEDAALQLEVHVKTSGAFTVTED